MIPVFPDLTEELTYFDVNSRRFNLEAEGWTRSHGIWVAAFGIAIALLGLGILNRQSSRMPTILALLLGIPLFALVASDYRDLEAVAELGWTSGLTVCLVGAIASVVGSITALAAQSRRRT